ncbi:MAG: hypothetical protein JWR84_235 [Caulobacter sp.]|nr:hypothetical protein [Caulobacter sp.]
MTRFIAALVAAFLLTPLAAQAQPAAPLAAQPPVAAFARLPAIQQAVISPDGTRLAYIGGTADERVTFITPIDGGAPVTIRAGAVDVKGIRWAGSRHLLIRVSMYDNDSDFTGGMKEAYSFLRDLIVDASTGDVIGQVLGDRNWNRLAIEIPVLAVVDGEQPYLVVEGLDVTADTGTGLDYIQRKGSRIVPSLWRVDLKTGKARMLDRSGRMTQSLITDLGGDLRARWDYDDVRNVQTLQVRKKGGAVWKPMESWRIDEATAEYIGYSDPDDAMIVRRWDKRGSWLVKRPLDGGAEVPLAGGQPAPHLDVVWDAARGAPVAITSGDERPTYQWLDPELGAIHARLSKALGGKQVTLVDWSRDRGRFIVQAEASDSAPVWYLYDARTKQASLIGDGYPELASASLSKTQWISYPARDGLKIPAYLTLPKARADGAKPPLVVLPHGGPAARDEYGFDWIVQFLASRGYAVLQPQFRGSAGFGVGFEVAGYGEWGGKMHTDLLDGVAAAGGYGIDNSRACIVGLSYGGYAAMAGAVFNPETFRCAVSVSGVSDLPLWVGASRRKWGEDSQAVAYWRKVIGDPRVAGEAMAAVSPARRLGARASPILLMHAELDTDVPMEQARVMERGLKNVGQSPPFVLLEGDDHYLSKSRSRIKFLSETEAFLGKHLPVAPRIAGGSSRPA